MSGSATNHVPRWLHGWAVATAVVAFPLILSGGSVTSLQVGMADPVWPTPPWYMLLVDTVSRGLGFAIEHSHRQIGWIVGVMVIVLAVGLWIHDRRHWVRFLGVAALLAVGLQGVLGGLRVVWHVRYGTELAMVHGFTGQLVFALLACVAHVTGRRWQTGETASSGDARRVQFLCLATTVLLVGQLVLGVSLRHLGVALEMHLVAGLGALLLIAILAVRVFKDDHGSLKMLRPSASVFVHLAALQVVLGLAAWWVGAGVVVLDASQITAARALLSTAHVGVGALLLAASTRLTLMAYRHLLSTPAAVPLPVEAAGRLA